LGEKKINGKLHSVERTPSENPVNIITSVKFQVWEWALVENSCPWKGSTMEFSSENYIVEQDLTQAGRKKHFPFQEDFGPCTSALWSGI
jgi:hypothetical protein